jgi:CRP-like cAMP-binding protein
MKSFPWKPLLQKLPIFSTIHDDQKIDALLADGVSTERDYAKDKDIVRQGEEGDSLFVIGSGSAEALLAVAGEETIHLSTMRKGDVFGEMAFFGRTERAATVRAKEDCTVLEIGGPGFQNLVEDCPDIGFRLLLLMGERLRGTNKQILALHLKTVDEKLKLFNNRLDSEQRSVDAFLKAAQSVFDQTKLRTDEVINSAERSRTRLNTSATVVGGFVTVLVALLGLFGWKQVADIGVQLDKATTSAQYVADVKKEMPGPTPLAEIKSSVEDLKRLKTEAEQLNKDAKELVDSAKENLKDSVVAAHRSQFFDAAVRGSGLEAVKAYAQIREAGGLDNELALMLDWMGSTVVAKAQPQPPGSDQELSVKNFVNLFQQAVVDAQKPRDKLDAYYLLLVYAYLTQEVTFEQREQGKYRGFATPHEALAALQKYSKSLPSEPPSLLETKGLKDHWLSQGADKDVLRKFSELALVGGK